MDSIYEKSRIMLPGDNGAVLAEASSPDMDTDTINIGHTFADDSLRRRGVTGKLMGAATKQLRETGKKTVLACYYTTKWFEKHPEYSSVVKG